MRILGISAFYHDSAAAIVEDGRIVAAAQEERFTRIKHDSEFPINAIAECLKSADLAIQEVDAVAFYDKPFLKFERLVETYLAFAPRGFTSFATAMPIWIKDKLFQKKQLMDELKQLGPDVDWYPRLHFSEHHHAHAASAFYPSPFERASVLTMDGVGEWATTSVAVGDGTDLKIVREIHFPHSLGLLYSALTYYLGFKVNSGEYKVMGLAPYGTPRFAQLMLDHLIDVKPDGSFRLDLSYFDYCTGLRMTGDKFDALFGAPARSPETWLTQWHMDVAASLQAVLEEVVLRLARSVVESTGIDRLCLAGGVALNCVANGKILRDGKAKELWVQPAAGDAGGAIGAALLVHHQLNGGGRRRNQIDGMDGSYLGPSFGQQEVERRLAAVGAKYSVLPAHELIDRIARLLEQGKAVGWFQSRMEFGPRALGNRSILADPRSPTMQKMLNLKVKFRESFRPFAPSVLREDVAEWFDLDADSPYMLVVAPVAASRRRRMTSEEEELFGIDKLNVTRSDIPAVTHVDYSARVQTVHRETNPRFHALISAFKALTGCPVLVNTSFNVRGEPIVCTPEDAFRCFMGTGIEVLAVENCLLLKEDQDQKLALDYTSAFDLD
jgi:carbamoyltransferase